MPGLIPEFIIVSAFVVLIICMLLGTLALIVGGLINTNKQLMILVAGEKSAKPELLRALVASQKPPQKNLKGIASGKKKDEKPANTNYTLEVGESNGV